jgi:hypothetical protein
VFPCCIGYQDHYSLPAGLLPTAPRHPDDKEEEAYGRRHPANHNNYNYNYHKTTTTTITTSVSWDYFFYDVSAHLYAIRGHKCALMPLQKPPNLLMYNYSLGLGVYFFFF